MTPMTPTTGVRVRRLVRFGSGRAWSVHQLLLAATSSAGALAFLLALDRAAGGFDPLFWLLLPVPALLLAVNASGWPTAYWAFMVFGWFYLTPSGSFSGWSPLAAAGLLLGHGSAALSASAPPMASLPGRVLRRWARQATVAMGAASAVALAASLLRGRVDGIGIVAQLVGLLGLAVGVWFLRSHPPEEHG
ncbi:MAG TPA: hypothetical protein VFT81_07240 [Dermatophilaceae bacterium]|nr:hypothetical protein [Dermatophilaceae bacterium]